VFIFCHQKNFFEKMNFENFNISSNNIIGVEAAKPLQYAIQVPYIKGFGFRLNALYTS